ncbi:MAG: pyridoxal phosphate-dependent aminotransferase [Rhodospirillales bacterium]
MFSSRLRWDLRPNKLSALLEAKRLAGAAILDLTESNPTRAGLSYPAGSILEALADRRSLVYEPHPAGSAEARSAVAGYYRARGRDIAPERILITAGTSESYAYLFKLFADPGDEVLAPRPSYPLFEFLAGLESVRIVQYPLVYHGSWSVDLGALERSISARTRAVVVVNPNNPTGSFLKKRELARLSEICAQRQLPIISDEVFADYAFRPDPERVETLAASGGALTFSLSGLSKVCGLPQMKLGWIAAGGPGADAALEKLELIADTYLTTGTPVQHALPRLLEEGKAVQEQIARRVCGNLDALRAAVAGSACQVLDAEGGWYAILRVPRTRSEEEWVLELLDKENVLAQPGFFYDFDSEAFLVLSLLTPPDVFRQGVSRVLALAE